MKIIPIKYTNINNSQNFKGLWGKTSRNTDYDCALGVPKVEDDYYYYPFADESSEEIKKIHSENTKAYVEDSSRYRIKDCKICATLPFNKNMYEAYTAIKDKKEITDNIQFIHYFVKDKYIDNEYGNKQKSAVNDIVLNELL